jgi:DNA-binding CsgD family transcriptional regulator
MHSSTSQQNRIQSFAVGVAVLPEPKGASVAPRQQSAAQRRFETDMDDLDATRTSSAPLATRTCPVTVCDGVIADVRHLLNELTARTVPAAQSTHDSAPYVLLDVVIEGHRCLVVRQPQREPEAGERAALSQRESQIVDLVAGGYSNKMIACALAISMSSVNTYLRRIFSKLSVSTRAAMVARINARSAASISL